MAKTIIVIILLILSTALSAHPLSSQPSWAEKGIYVEYHLKAEVVKNPGAEGLGSVNSTLWGYAEETARYVFVDINSKVFTLRKDVLSATLKTGSPTLAHLLEIIDHGEANTISAGKSKYLVFHWSFRYPGIKYTILAGNANASLIYPLNIYVYMDVSRNSKEIKSMQTYAGTTENTSFTEKASIEAIYDGSTGMLKSLEETISYSIGGAPLIIVTLSVSQVGSNIPKVLGQAFNMETMLALIAGGMVAAVIGFAIYYVRVKKEI